MITVNVRYFRRERRRRGHFQTHWKTDTGVQLDLAPDADQVAISEALRARLPANEGWVVYGFHIVQPGREPIPVKVF